MTSTSPSKTDDDLEPLLEVIFRKYHYDFRHYARSSLRRRVADVRAALGIASIERLVERVAEGPSVLGELLHHLTIQVSDFFRDPEYHLALRQRVAPILATHPSLKIWVAGCATGEEAYSIAMMLHEEGLLERTLVYATDIDAESLATAEAGNYPIDRLRGFDERHLRSGGRASLSDFGTTSGTRFAFSRLLREHIVFADHSLATDAAFAEVHLVSCRNVLIYFDQKLQTRATGLFRESLCSRGFLGLGANETLSFSSHAHAFESFAPAERLFRLR